MSDVSPTSIANHPTAGVEAVLSAQVPYLEANINVETNSLGVCDGNQSRIQSLR